MKELQIVKIGDANDAVLFEVAKPVEKITPEIQRFIFGMRQAMITNEGCGLAANQVGRAINAIVFKDKKAIRAMINPQIQPYGPLETKEEGCLSNPGKLFPITRAAGVRAKFTDLMGRLKYDSFSGLTARIIQHEVDHLNGINIHQRHQMQTNQSP